jgi:hypothetical protein
LCITNPFCHLGPPTFSQSHQQLTTFGLIFAILVVKEVRVYWDIQEGPGGSMIGTFDTSLRFSALLMLAFDATTNLQCEIQSEQFKNFKPFRTYLCHFFQLLQSEVSPLITLLVLQVREQLFAPSLVDHNLQKQLGKVSELAKLRIP